MNIQYDIISTNNLKSVPAMLVTSGNVTEGVIFDMNILTQKKCSKCGKWKDRESEFGKRKEARDGRKSRCKACDAQVTQNWRERNPDKAKHGVLERVRKWYADNKERAKENRRKRYLQNTEIERERNSKWKAEHKEQHREGSRRWQANHPENVKARSHNRRAQIKASDGKFTALEWRALKEFYGFACLCCGRREPEIKLTPDHVLPLVLGGSNSIDNIQPLCLSCNSRKGAKHIDYREKQ